MPTTQEQFHDQLEKLVVKFQAHNDDYKSPGYSETDACAEFIDPLFVALGWDVKDEAALGAKRREVLREQGEVSGKPDYTFRIGEQIKFFVEAKAPRVKLSGKDILQANRYAYSTSSVDFAVLTDFEEFRLYDATLKPDPDHPELGLVFSYRCDQYLIEAALADLWKLSRDEVAAGSLNTLLKQDAASRRARVPVDQSFLGDLTRWREQLAKDCFRHTGMDAIALNEAVQVLLDRLIFIRMAEDRRILEAESLRKLEEQWSQARHRSLRAMLDRLFVQVNDNLNGEVFKPNAALDGAAFDDALAAKIIHGLYDGPYDFGVIGVELLGSIYERYLGKTIRVTATRAVVEDKPKVRKAGGVYYTPKHIVDYIVDQTVGKLIEGKSPAQIAGERTGSPLRILDPACGSGSFLLGAYQKLLDYHTQYLAERAYRPKPGASPQARLLREGDGGEFKLTLAQKAEILRNNIYGVDIDPQAVEITMMSLYTKMLEGERGLIANHAVLPLLRDNIKCGNSLIGTDYFGQAAADAEDWRRVRPLDWEEQFPEAMKAGGFDCVIGNPPYVSGRETFSSAWKEYITSHYQSYQGKHDLYIYFIERGLDLLRLEGMFAFIIPNTLLVNENTAKLRQFIMGHASIKSIRLFEKRVFQAAQVESVIIALQNTRNSHARSADVLILADGKEYFVRQQDFNTPPLFKFNIRQDSKNTPILEKGSRVSVPMGELTDICVGIQLGGSHGNDTKASFLSQSRLDSTCKPVLDGKEIGRYSLKWEKRFVKYGDWLHRKRDKKYFVNPKIVVRQIGAVPIATFDDQSFYTLNTLVST